MWDIKSDDSDVVLTLAGHSGTVRCLNLNGNRLVSGSVDRSIKVSSMLHFCSFVLWFRGQIKEGHSLSACALHICTLYLVQTQVQSKDSDVDVGYRKNCCGCWVSKKLFEALSGLYVSMYEVDSLLFVNRGDIFADSYLFEICHGFEN